MGKVVDNAITDVMVGVDLDKLNLLLQTAYAEEVLAYYQYNIVAPFLSGVNRPEIETAFRDIALDELNDHSAKLLKRMNELDFIPTLVLDFANIEKVAKCAYLVPSVTEHGGFDLKRLLEQAVASEGCAVNTYTALVEFCEVGGDYVTAEVAKGILADEQEHITRFTEFYADLAVGAEQVK